jgi:hypothetical protein
MTRTFDNLFIRLTWDALATTSERQSFRKWEDKTK